MLVSLAHPPATACSRHFTIALQEAAPWPPSPSTSAKTLLLGVRTPCSWPESPHNKSHNTFGKHPPQKRSENSSSSQVLGSGPRFKEEKKRTKKRHFTNFAAFPQTTEPGHKRSQDVSGVSRCCTPLGFPHSSSLLQLLHGRRGAQDLSRNALKSSGVLSFPISLLPHLKRHLQEPSAETLGGDKRRDVRAASAAGG